jgi:uncharacterized protein
MNVESAIKEQIERLIAEGRYLKVYRRCAPPLLLRHDGLVLQARDPVVEVLEHRDGTTAADRLRAVATRSQEAARLAAADLSALAAKGFFSLAPAYRPLARGIKRPVAGCVLMVAQACNLRCKYCYGGDGAYGAGQALQSWEVARAAVDQLIAGAEKQRDLHITFFGGEPLLNLALIKRVIAYCESLEPGSGKRFVYSITTNGTLLDEPTVDFLIQKGVRILLSFDGTHSIQDSHRPFASGSGSGNSVIAAMTLLRRRGIPIKARATVTDNMANKETLDQMEVESRQYGVESLALSPVDARIPLPPGMQVSQAAADALQALIEERLQSDVRALQTGCTSTSLIDACRAWLGRLVRGRSAGIRRCGACFGMSAVSADGAIFPCHRFVGMAEYQIGHVAEGGRSIDAIHRLLSSADRVLSDRCSGCIAATLCGGDCLYHLADGAGAFRAPDPHECARVLRSLDVVVQTLPALAELPGEVVGRFLAIRRAGASSSTQAPRSAVE